MKTTTRRALIFSLCLHLLLLFSAVFVIRPALRERFVDLTVVDIIQAANPRMPVPRIKVEEVKSSPRQPTERQVRALSTQPRPVKQANTLPRTNVLAMNQPNPALDSAVVTPAADTDLSTALRDLSAARAVLTQAESAPAGGEGGSGFGLTPSPSVQRAPVRTSIHQEMDNDDDVVSDGLPLGTGDAQSAPVQLGAVMKGLAKHIVDSSGGGPVDVVFVVDTSGSMGNNIKAVAEHLVEMIDVYESANVDYALGLTEFWAMGESGPTRNRITVRQLMTDMREYKRLLLAITPRQDEHALDAIEKTVREIQFRPTSTKHLIVVTDEPFTSMGAPRRERGTPDEIISREKGTVDTIIALCREFAIRVNVLGLPNAEHQRLAAETDGRWHVIPEDPQERIRRPMQNARYQARSLRNASWAAVSEIGRASFVDLVENALDVVLFIDGSRSMEDKLAEFLKQFELVVRDWDNALVDYQIGVVRFRTGTGSFDYVNVFQPPQTLDDIRKIIELPYQGNERLLDAIVKGVEQIRLRPGTQAYWVIVTDEPSTGEYSPEAVINLCQEHGAKVSVIGTFDTFQQKVAQETAGVWVPIPNGKTTNSLNW